MSPRPKIYWRERGRARRAYADLRDYADVGGGREALIARGEKLATTDATTAQVLLGRRLEELDAARRGRALHGETRHATLADFASTHLVAKAESKKFTEHWLEVTEKCLDRAVEFFGADRDLASITVADVRRWTKHLLAMRNGRPEGYHVRQQRTASPELSFEPLQAGASRARRALRVRSGRRLR